MSMSDFRLSMVHYFFHHLGTCVIINVIRSKYIGVIPANVSSARQRRLQRMIYQRVTMRSCPFSGSSENGGLNLLLKYVLLNFTFFVLGHLISMHGSRNLELISCCMYTLQIF